VKGLNHKDIPPPGIIMGQLAKKQSGKRNG
jgi:hypothetical protein